MAEPQIPGTLMGMPAEGNPGPVQPTGSPGYVAGPTPNQPGYAPAGNPSVSQAVPQQRSYRQVCEWRW